MNGYGDNPYRQNYATGGGSAGGGFMPMSQTDGSGKKSGANTLRPVTIRQILNAEQPHPDAEFTLDGVELGQLTFIAVVRNLSRNATNVSYSMEDGTGQIEVRQWLDSTSDDTHKATEIEQNKYVRVLGTIKSFQNRRSISAGHIRLIEDFNEVLFHKLDAIFAHLQLIKGGGTNSSSAALAAGAGGGVSQTYGDVSGMGAYSGSINSTDQYKDLPPVQQKIMQIVMSEAPNHQDGVHIAFIGRMIKGFDPSQIKNAVDELSQEGYLYTAADDDHFLPTA